ncbi:MAG: trigger factor [Candidatus Paceibacterota bacterium]|jgi:FKBP-type peptidyl-prolyl cis-trans isomerase (trigger factor)
MSQQKHYTDIKINSLPDREIEIIGTITAEKMALMRERALAKIKADLELPGFRKGNAPDNIVAQKVGEGKLLEEAAEIALSEEYPNILEENKIDAIGRPEISITKIGLGSSMEFKVKTSLMPEVKLGDYKKLASSANSPKRRDEILVLDSEIEDVIKDIQKNIAHQKLHKSADEAEHNHAEIKDSDLPEVNDEFAKMIGGFKDVVEMKEKIKENIALEKSLKEKDKRRTVILEAIMKKSAIDLPKIIVDGELEKMLAQFKDDLARASITYEDYLKHIKKTEEDLKTEWKDVAVKRAKSQIILNNIAKEEAIAPKEEEVKKEMEHILSQYKDAERFRVRMYVETFLTNELVFQFLESQK